jgi:hypothetical protein
MVSISSCDSGPVEDVIRACSASGTSGTHLRTSSRHDASGDALRAEFVRGACSAVLQMISTCWVRTTACAGSARPTRCLVTFRHLPDIAQGHARTTAAVSCTPAHRPRDCKMSSSNYTADASPSRPIAPSEMSSPCSSPATAPSRSTRTRSETTTISSSSDDDTMTLVPSPANRRRKS